MFKEINKVIDILENGGVILYPTDTIWGLGCDATNAAAVAKIYQIKQRAVNKSMIVLLPDAKSVLQYVANPHPDIINILRSFNKPTTVIYQNGLGFADNVPAKDGSIGIRVTQDPFCKTLLKRFKKPIVSTSANISGLESPGTFHEISDEVKALADYIVQHRQGESEAHQASDIISIQADGSITKIR